MAHSGSSSGFGAFTRTRTHEGDRENTAPICHLPLAAEEQAQGGVSFPDFPSPSAPARATLVVGVDIGRTGGLALVTGDGDLVDVADMPVLDDGPAGRPAVNAPLLALLLRQWGPTQAYVEFVGARPGEAPSGAFAFGRCRGVIEGVLGTMGLPVKLLTPPTWKRAIGIKPGKDGAKDAARSEAIRRWPVRADLFAAKGSDGRAEACLIAVAGMAREAQGR